ncbi:alpha-glucuronidase family glycosyl hydrolase, partial [Flavobacterium sp. 3-210]
MAKEYKDNLQGLVVLGNSETIKIAEKELKTAFLEMLGNTPEIKRDLKEENNLIVGSQSNLNSEIKKQLESDFDKVNHEGFIIKSIS